MADKKRSAQGAGSIRKKTRMQKGVPYTYWEARYTVGRDPGTGKQIQKSVYGKTQREVLDKLQQANVSIAKGTFIDPERMTVSQWLDAWLGEYVSGSVKPLTYDSYKMTVETHLKGGLGAVKLSALNTMQIQRFYNGLAREGKRVPRRDAAGKPEKRNGKTVYGCVPLSAKSIKNVHGVLHRALDKAVELRYIPFNPADVCTLPRVEKKEIKPLSIDEQAAFLKAIEEHKHRNLFTLILFTGLREGEALGLTWDCVDFKKGTVLINKQLQVGKYKGSEYHLAETKNGKGRKISVAPSVMGALKAQKAMQAEMQLAAGSAWSNEHNLVFTNEIGGHLGLKRVYTQFKQLAEQIGRPDARLHDLRHTFAVNSLQNGDSPKTVQENLGHATSTFTLNVYGHVSEQMRTESAARMEQLIQAVKNA